MIIRSATLALFILTTAGCTASTSAPSHDGEKIVAAVLETLTSDRKAVCVDNRTTGLPLTVFAMMAIAPEPARNGIAWYTPEPLRPQPEAPNRLFFRDNVAEQGAHIQRPQNGGRVLSKESQRKIDKAALALSKAPTGGHVFISSGWKLPGVLTRWWPVNSLSARCNPNYVISDPVWSGSTGFVTVTANHWGTTYALVRSGNAWVSVAQWSNWLH